MAAGRRPELGPGVLTLTRDEFAGKLLPAVPFEHRAIVCVAAGCGLRWGECAGLPWEAVDLDAAELRVRQVAVELSGRLDVRPYPKSGEFSHHSSMLVGVYTCTSGWDSTAAVAPPRAQKA